MALTLFHPSPQVLAAAVVLDLLLGDPVYPLHPIRLMGRSLTWFEARLRAIKLDGYGGGIVLFVLLAVMWVGVTVAVLFLLRKISSVAAWLFYLFMAYSFLALRDLLHHAWAAESAARKDDLEGTRIAIAKLVGRDTDKMDLAACRRAAIESLSENLTDGFISALFWYVIAGLPGLVLFKVVSTMDSMVGYKTPQYLKFGWCGARLDDAMNYIPARLTWLLLSLFCLVLPKCSGAKAFRIGWQQHAILPGPNSGWSEAAMAGGLERKLLGPIWAKGVLVTDVWLGDAGDPPAGDATDVFRTSMVISVTALFAASVAVYLAWLRI